MRDTTSLGRWFAWLPRGRGVSRFAGKNATGPVSGHVRGCPVRMPGHRIIIVGPRTGKTIWEKGA